mmetsp:Transcript_15497/g.50950  ORF Transcript_15497/g.50950 Transcript_15497/m.50950 type:complete len:418 (-) Transcript_15497:718-1971(-)
MRDVIRDISRGLGEGCERSVRSTRSRSLNGWVLLRHLHGALHRLLLGGRLAARGVDAVRDASNDDGDGDGDACDHSRVGSVARARPLFVPANHAARGGVAVVVATVAEVLAAVLVHDARDGGECVAFLDHLARVLSDVSAKVIHDAVELVVDEHLESILVLDDELAPAVDVVAALRLAAVVLERLHLEGGFGETGRGVRDAHAGVRLVLGEADDFDVLDADKGAFVLLRGELAEAVALVDVEVLGGDRPGLAQRHAALENLDVEVVRELFRAVVAVRLGDNLNLVARLERRRSAAVDVEPGLHLAVAVARLLLKVKAARRPFRFGHDARHAHVLARERAEIGEALRRVARAELVPFRPPRIFANVRAHPLLRDRVRAAAVLPDAITAQVRAEPLGRDVGIRVAVRLIQLLNAGHGCR